MALSKQTKTDKIEVVKVYDHYTLDVRELTEILESGAVISQNFKRYVLTPDYDVSKITDATVKVLFQAVMTDSVKANYQTFLEAQKAQEAELNSE
jgi:hypothetical protein